MTSPNAIKILKAAAILLIGCLFAYLGYLFFNSVSGLLMGFFALLFGLGGDRQEKVREAIKTASDAEKEYQAGKEVVKEGVRKTEALNQEAAEVAKQDYVETKSNAKSIQDRFGNRSA
jgi:hypothetical protein